ncbi:MAG: thioredoxin domain-containing protein [Patescibacteria group bacterium]
MLKKIFASALTLIVVAGCSSQTTLNRETPPAGTKVVVVEFSDFNCPACRAASELVANLQGIPNLYIEFRHRPLPISGHETSPSAANTFECARAQNFGNEMETALFANQGKFSTELFLQIPTLYKFGSKFDSEKFKKCIDDNEFSDLVKSDSDFAQGIGVNATPTFFVNGVETERSDLAAKIQAAFDAVK